jgi:hypothetical protein
MTMRGASQFPCCVPQPVVCETGRAWTPYEITIVSRKIYRIADDVQFELLAR